MFGGHLPELVVLLVVALVVFGPKRLPEIGGAMGKGIREFKKGTTDLMDSDDTSSRGDVRIPDEPVRVVTPDSEPVATPVSAATRDRDAS